MKSETLDKLLCLLDVRLNAIGMCEVSQGWRLGLPCPDGVLIHYILQGSGVLRSADGSVVSFRPDSLIFLHSNCGSHEIAATGEESLVAEWKASSQPLGEGMMQFCAGDGPIAITSACAMASAECGGLDIFEQLREPVVETLDQTSPVRTAFALMLDELRQPRLGTRALSEALMKQCLILALRSQIERGQVTLMSLPVLRDMRLLKALLRMIENPAQDHRLEELARISGMSRSLFAERFAQTFERPPMDLLKQVRLHRAANLLRSSQLPVQIVAMTVGYASRSYFSRAFRSAYGTDPTSFREEARRARSGNLRERENA